MADAIDTAVDLFATYSQLWVAVEAIVSYMNPNSVPTSGEWLSVWTPLLVLTLIMPSKLAFGSAIAVRIAMHASKAPELFDSTYWGVQTDLILLGAIVLMPRRQVIPTVEWVTRTQMGLFYVAAGFWKMNTAFLDPRVSCATIFPLSLLSYLPAAAVPSGVVHVLARTAPWVTIVGEMSLGLGLLLPFRATRRVGVLLRDTLHIGITLTPFPNQIATFSIFGLSRMFFALPAAWAAAQAEALAIPKTPSGVA